MFHLVDEYSLQEIWYDIFGRFARLKQMITLVVTLLHLPELPQLYYYKV